MSKLGATLIFLLFGYSQAQDANCDFAQNVVPGSIYYVSSPNYPNSYPPGVQCRWIGTCPTGYNCKFDCNLAMPQSSGCTVDSLLISRSGDPQLSSAQYYCGTGTLSAVSTGSSISMGLISSKSSPGGKFNCTLRAVVDSSTSSCSCGYRKQNRIVGGQNARPNEFPSMVGVIYRDEGVIKCGGVIISKNYILTAGHCVVGRDANTLAVVVGEHDTSASSTTRQAFLVSSYLVHPQYTAANYDYDIAILKCADIPFSAAVGPVCLPFKFANSDFTNAIVTLLGWGTTVPGGPKSKILQKVDVSVISQASCRNSISSVTAQQMCTYAKGKDACQDDSGGPALYTDPATGLLFHVGIISYGKFCASSDPAVNTRITALLDWVVNNAPADYCRK